MAIEVFNRKESKFLISNSLYKEIKDELLEYMNPDKFNVGNKLYTISNIYYDTDDNHLIRTSLSKPKYKEKLRVRAYGVPKLQDKVFLEIKKKVCGVVNKRRTSLVLSEAYDFTATGILPEYKDYMNKQVLNEIQYMLSIYDLKPRLYLAYEREAFFSKDGGDLRITFDRNIRSRRYDLKLERGDHGQRLLYGDEWLMEVKAEKNIPLWLSQMLSKYKIFKTSFSKYGTEYNQYVMNDRVTKGDNNIWNQYLIQPYLVNQYHY